MNLGKALSILAPAWGAKKQKLADCLEARMKFMDTDDLELHRLPFQLYGTNLEVNSNGTDITLCVCVVCKPQK